MKKTIIRAAVILLSSIVLGYFLLVLGYLIPAEGRLANLRGSAEEFITSGAYPIEPYSSRQLDYFTDSLMLLESGYEAYDNAFYSAVETPFYALEGSDLVGTIVALGQGADESALNPVNYSRYWHGYQLILRPLLLKFIYFDIMQINTYVLYFLILLTVSVMIKKAPRCVIPFVLSLSLLGPTAISKCLQFSGVTYIMLLTTLVILLNPKKIRSDGKIEFVFMISGIAVAYFDLLTFPTVALTMPLTLAYVMTDENRRSLVRLIKCSAFWMIGYAGMWAGKWVIDFICEGPSFLADNLFATFKFRAGNELNGAQIDRVQVLSNNFNMMMQNFGLIITIICYAILTVLSDIRSYKRITLKSVTTNLFLFVPALISVGWILALSNHSHIHSFFTYRTLAPLAFILLCALNVETTAKTRKSSCR